MIDIEIDIEIGKTKEEIRSILGLLPQDEYKRLIDAKIRQSSRTTEGILDTLLEMSRSKNRQVVVEAINFIEENRICTLIKKYTRQLNITYDYILPNYKYIRRNIHLDSLQHTHELYRYTDHSVYDHISSIPENLDRAIDTNNYIDQYTLLLR